MSNCLICFSDFEDDKKYSCCDPRCTEHICFECLKRYIEIAEEEHTLITCPREKCEGVFDEQAIDKELVPQFRNLLLTHYRLVKTGAIEAIKKKRAIGDIVKAEKMKFILDTMPKAVRKVAGIVFTGRINKIRKSQTGRDSNRVSRTCINLVCNGFLDENFHCTKCKTVFCKDCEEVMGGDGTSHTCNQEAIDSLKVVNNMVSCPSCKTKIEKAEGCMAITCAVCKTNFWYNTGEKGDAGNHGKYKEVILRKTISFTAEYRDHIPERYFPIISDLERTVLNFQEAKIDAAIDRMLLQPHCSHSRFSELYSEMVRGSLKVTIASKKLILLEKILQKREPDYEKAIEGIFGDSRRVSVSRVVAKDKDSLFLDMPRLFESLDIGSRDMQTSPMEIKKAIETCNGIIRGFYWEWCIA